MYKLNRLLSSSRAFRPLITRYITHKIRILSDSNPRNEATIHKPTNAKHTEPRMEEIKIQSD